MIWSILFILFVHWVSDFVLQTHNMSTKKNSSNYYLSVHVGVYTFTTIVMWVIVFAFTSIHISSLGVFLSFLTIFISHWITDYFTSRLTSRLYKEERYHDFFVVIGFDQVLHYSQLLITFNYLLQI